MNVKDFIEFSNNNYLRRLKKTIRLLVILELLDILIPQRYIN